VGFRCLSPRRRAARQIQTHYSALIGDVYATTEGRTLYIFTCTAPTTAGAPAAMTQAVPPRIWAALCGSGEECARRWQSLSRSCECTRRRGLVHRRRVVSDVHGPSWPNLSCWRAAREKVGPNRGRPLYTFYEDQEPGTSTVIKRAGTVSRSSRRYNRPRPRRRAESAKTIRSVMDALKSPPKQATEIAAADFFDLVRRKARFQQSISDDV